jgi:hypothetical protein
MGYHGLPLVFAPLAWLLALLPFIHQNLSPLSADNVSHQLRTPARCSVVEASHGNIMVFQLIRPIQKKNKLSPNYQLINSSQLGNTTY